MKIAIGADHGGFDLKTKLIEHLTGQGNQVLDQGTDSTAAVDYPVFARKVAEVVSTGQAERGIMIDGAGIGSSMVANKVAGVRAAMAYDLSSARNSREHNDANLLTLGAGLIGSSLATQIVDVFLTAECTEPRHKLRVAMITDVGGGSAPVVQPAVQAAAVAGQLAANSGVGLADLSEEDLARIMERLTGLLGGNGDAWHGGPCVGSCPDTARQFIELGARMLSAGPDITGEIPDDMARYIDHTILKPDATPDMIEKIVSEAREHSFRSVCVNPVWVRVVADGLRGSGVLTCSVVGFPLGANTPDIKGMEARKAIRDGAKEIDMVINVGRLKGGDDDFVWKDILAVTEACRDGSAVSKVIIETALLTDEEKVRVCELAKRARANFVKTSTGFASGGATAEDVALMASVVRGAGMEVKASGGIKSFDDAKRMIDAGATRIGASASIAIVQEAQQGKVTA
ncbi:MAG: deoxyribose-phosphate aldolase [Candidatus Krumholzibacteria bacterium]|nr:deoxyribose-phosphate aldolase [Candidatus Krumholzibacteria bacterium]